MAEQPDDPIQIESLCMRCSLNGTTTVLTTSIPHFRDVVLMAFECPHCGTRNSELQPIQTCEDYGVRFRLSVPEGNRALLSRQIVKSDRATVTVPELELEIPPANQKGCLTTIEGLLTQVAADLAEGQEIRRQIDPDTAAKLDAFCQRLRSCAQGSHAFTLQLDDPSGNSFIETPSLEQDPHLRRHFYQRTDDQTRSLGLSTPSDVTAVHHGPEGRGFELSQNSIEEITGSAFLHRYSPPEEVLVFPGTCFMCHTPTETKMYPTKIPYFKEVIIMANACEMCGYKNSESVEDLSRDVIKSDSASVEIPAAAVTLNSGAAMITTVEGMTRRFLEDLKKMAGFQLGDSADDSDKHKFHILFETMETLLECKETWTLVLKDPLANSFIMPRSERIDDDPNLKIEAYERTDAENEEFGIDVLQTSQS